MININRNEKELFQKIIIKADVIFHNPGQLYNYDNIINGCIVKHPISRISEKMYAVGNNTWRGFHRTPDSIYGAKDIFTKYFTSNKAKIISALKHIKTIEDLDSFEDNICTEIKELLTGNIVPHMLNSYNKIRKPVDLYIEHIVSMSNDLSSVRSDLVKILFLPLDSQIFSSSYIFDRSLLSSLGIKSNSTFKDVYNRKIYSTLQNYLYNKSIDISKSLGKEYNRIYFDLLWNNRYEKPGNNLFETNF